MTNSSTKGLRDEGFSLLEVLVAMALMAVALLAVFKLQAQNLNVLSEANSMTSERYFAQDRLARLSALKQIEPGEKDGESSNESFPFSYREEISAHPAFRGFYRVNVKIWGEEKEGHEPVAYETYFYRRPK